MKNNNTSNNSNTMASRVIAAVSRLLLFPPFFSDRIFLNKEQERVKPHFFTSMNRGMLWTAFQSSYMYTALHQIQYV